MIPVLWKKELKKITSFLLRALDTALSPDTALFPAQCTYDFKTYKINMTGQKNIAYAYNYYI